MTVTVNGQPREISLMQRVLDGVAAHGWASFGGMADLIGIAMFAVLCVLLVRAARETLEV